MKAANLVAALVIGISLILAAAVFALVNQLLSGAEQTGSGAGLARLEAEVDQQARDIAALRDQVKTLTDAQQAISAAPPVVAAAPQPSEAPVPETEVRGTDQFGGNAPTPDETEDLTSPMMIAANRFNQGIERPRPEVLRQLLGEPRDSYSQDCLPVTNARMLATLQTRQIAGFKLSMLRPALDSLQAIMDRVKQEEPDIYAAIGTAGALCARYVRGSNGVVSSHAWGLAVDVTMKQQLDRMGDNSTQFGLVVLAEYFNDAGWYWGAGYSREDSMHFEVGEALLRQWVAEGKL